MCANRSLAEPDNEVVAPTASRTFDELVARRVCGVAFIVFHIKRNGFCSVLSSQVFHLLSMPNRRKYYNPELEGKSAVLKWSNPARC
jgi:hypothetical protein